jgi:hypothetical protein
MGEITSQGMELGVVVDTGTVLSPNTDEPVTEEPIWKRPKEKSERRRTPRRRRL